MYFPLFVGVLCFYVFCYALLCIHSGFASILKRERKLIALLLLSYRCIVTINVLWLFLTVPWVRLQCVIMVFPDHTHLLFNPNQLTIVDSARLTEIKNVRVLTIYILLNVLGAHSWIS